MSTYRAPLRDMQFVPRELAGVDEIAKLPGLGDAPDVLDAILEEASASAFASEVLDPQSLWLHHEIVYGSASVMRMTEEPFDLDRQLLVVA